ncbi:unnamed protein product [Calypogeia fissa]
MRLTTSSIEEEEHRRKEEGREKGKGKGVHGRGLCKAAGRRGEVVEQKGPGRKGHERKYLFGRELAFGSELLEKLGHADLLRMEDDQSAADTEAGNAADMAECGRKGKAKGGAAALWWSALSVPVQMLLVP